MAPGTDPLATLSAAGASDAPPQPPPTTTGTPTETTPPVTVTTGAPGQVNPVAMAQQMLQPDAAPSYQQPTMEPEHEAWWRRALDQVGSIMGGDQTIHITKDPQGNVSVTHDPSTGKEKWARVAAAALSGAARGMAVGQGPGGAGRAVAAGFQQGEQQQQQQLDAANAQAANMNQQMLAKANHALLDQKILQEQFRTKAEPITFSQQQAEYALNMATKMQDIGARKIGSVKNSSELVAFGNTNPDAIAAHTGASDDVVMPIPQPDGSTDMYLIPANTAKRLNPTPHTYHRAVLDDQNVGKVNWIDYTEQGNTKSFGDQALADKALIDANNNTIKTAQERGTAEQEAQTKANEATNKQPLTKAETAKAFADARLANSQAAVMPTPGSGYTPGLNPVLDDTAEGLASGRYLQSTLPKRTGKGQPTPQEQNYAANIVSQQKYGLPYSPTIIDQENKFATNTKTQAYLEGIDRMTGAHGDAGQLNQLIDLAQKAGIGENAPLNTIKQAVRTRLGNEAANNFSTLLTETQSNLGTLIGNPLLGSGESDMKLRTAQHAFGENPTLSSLRGQVATVTDVLNRSRQDMAANNRYIQQRYGTRLSPSPAATPPPAATAYKQGVNTPQFPIAQDAQGHKTQWNGQTWATLP